MTTGRKTTASNTELRVALIGAGKMGLNHIRALRGCTSARLVAVADPNADRSQLTEYLPANAEVLLDANELFDRVRPDVVHIVTPPHTHTALARAALMSGAHVYVEKPFTSTLSEADSLVHLAEERGLQLCAGHQCLFDHASIIARRRLHEIGSVVHVESYFSFRTVRKAISPVDQSMDILPHAVYMLLDFMRAGDHAGTVSIDGLSATADGSVYGLFTKGPCRGILAVNLRARPVEQYVNVVGTNGCMRIDLVSGAVTVLPGAGANIGAALVNPYRASYQTVTGATGGFVRNLRERKFGYPGLRRLFQGFYDSVRLGTPPVMTVGAILEVVSVCEEIGRAQATATAQEEHSARVAIARYEQMSPSPPSTRGVVLVTGAGGFLGRRTVDELRRRGWPVRALTRRPIRFVHRVAGVEYRECDLADGVSPDVMEAVSAVVHCAAETAGGKPEHERNSIRASQMVLEAAKGAGVKRFVHISSVAVLKPSAGAVVDEETAVETSLERGPYAWGKAESERLVLELGRRAGIDVKVIRLGPLVDYASFDPPGRLGREIGPWFVAVGPRQSRLAVVEVSRAASVIAVTVEQYASIPPIVNLLEPDSPTRAALVARYVTARPDLRVVWVPMIILKLASPPLKLLQRLLFGVRRPLDIASAFETIHYNTKLASELVGRAESSPAPARPRALAG